MPIPGVTVDVVDEPIVSGGIPTATDRAFLLTADVNAPATPTLVTNPAQALSTWPTATTMLAELDALLRESNGRAGLTQVQVVKIPTGTGALAATLALLPADMGPGQIVAPSVVLAADQALIAQHAWTTNRIYLANGPANATDSALATLAAALIDTGYGRNTGLFADYAVIPGTGASTRTVPWAVIEAGLIARNDLTTGNPNLAAAGVQGIAQYALGLSAERSDAAMATLRTAQVNVARRIASGAPRAYGYRTLADLDLLPHWWDLSGSRTVMDVRAHSAADSEAIAFGQLDPDNLLLDKWNGVVSKRCLELRRDGALFGTPDAAFKVDTGPLINPLSELQAGRAHLSVRLKTSPFAEALGITIARQPITA
jgi:hypothetical protein